MVFELDTISNSCDMIKYIINYGGELLCFESKCPITIANTSDMEEIHERHETSVPIILFYF